MSIGSHQEAASEPALRLDIAALAAFLDGAFPPTARAAFGRLETVAPGHVRVRLEPTEAMVRPGGIVSGPVLMGLADFAAYAAVLAHVGPVAMAVSNTLNISFLRACRVIPIIADARLLKLGRRTSTIEVRLWQDDEAKPVAQAIVGFMLPVEDQGSRLA